MTYSLAVTENTKWIWDGIGAAFAVLFVGWLTTWAWNRFRAPSATERAAAADLLQRQKASRPYYRWTNSNTPDWVTFTQEFENTGGTVTNLRIQTTSAATAIISPAGSLARDQMGFVRFTAKTGRLSPPLYFDIRCETSLDEENINRFVLRGFDQAPSPV